MFPSIKNNFPVSRLTADFDAIIGRRGYSLAHPFNSANKDKSGIRQPRRDAMLRVSAKSGKAKPEMPSNKGKTKKMV
jgi:hypothetical protein